MGFGKGPFGRFGFGQDNWTYRVLYLDLPKKMIQQDQANGGLYEKWVLSLARPINTMRNLINNFNSQQDPIQIRLDLLRYYSAAYGLTTDVEEAETFQRTSADLYARFLLIKGTAQSFVVLARVHGFDATISELWRLCDGTETDVRPVITGETVGTFT